MKKKKFLKKTFLTFSTLLLTAMGWGLQAQVLTTSLKVTYVSSEGETVEDELVFDGAEITVLDNAVTVTSPIAESNKSYVLDQVRILAFETTPGSETGLREVITSTLKAYVKDGVLHINAPEAIKQFTVWTITGAAVYAGYSDNTETEVNISGLPHGVYLLQAGELRVKFVK